MERVRYAQLAERALIRLSGPEWRGFLQGLITQDVETMTLGDVRYAALLTPQGRLLFDMFIWAQDDGAVIDVQADGRETLMQRLAMYRLRAKVDIAAVSGDVLVSIPRPAPTPDVDASDAAETPWRPDPRLPALGGRAIGMLGGLKLGEMERLDASIYDANRIRLGVGDLQSDGLADKSYAVEANLDLLNGVDFKKGCFVGQEITSRMKRRGAVKTRLIPITFQGDPPPKGAEVLAGALRAGEIASGRPGCALAMLRLDRALGCDLTVEGRGVELAPPPWLVPALASVQAA